MDEAYERAREILTTNKDKLIEISELLIDRETLEGSDFEALFENISRPEPRVFGPPARVQQPAAAAASRQLSGTPGLQGIPGVAAMLHEE